MPFPDLTGLSETLQIVAVMSFFGCLGIVFAVVRIGMVRGAKSIANSATHVEVAGALISKDDAKDIITAIDRHTDATRRNTEVMERAIGEMSEARTALAVATALMPRRER